MDYVLEHSTKLGDFMKDVVTEAKAVYPEYSKEQQINALARTLFAEGRSGSEAGMRRVLDSILARSGNNSNNIVGIVSEPRQYSCWNGMKPYEWNPKKFDVRDAAGAAKEPDNWNTAVKLATNAVNGTYTPTHTEPFYHTRDVHPDWSKNKKGTVDGDHIFYTNKTINGTDTYIPKSRYTVNQVNDKNLISPKDAIAAEIKSAGRGASKPAARTAVKPAVKTAVTPKASAQKSGNYTISKGDTISSIAKNAGTTVDAITKANAGLNPNVIRPGQQISLPK